MFIVGRGNHAPPALNDSPAAVYERFTNPTPHGFVTLNSTTKLGLGLPNKVMSTCVLSKLELDESKKFGEREFSFEFFFIEFRESL